MTEEYQRYLDYLFRWDNPVYLAILFVVLIIILLLQVKRFILIPRNKRHQQEKRELELKFTRQMALFSMLDPDPVLRIDVQGDIIFFNEIAKKKLNMSNKNITYILPSLNSVSIKEIIEENKHLTISYKSNKNSYTVLITGNNNLGFAHLYFRDITERVILENRLKVLSSTLLDKMEDDRKRIAAELHDGVGQELLTNKLLLQNLSDEINNKKQELIIGKVCNSLNETIEGLRNTIYELKPKILEEVGLGPALTALAHSVYEASHIKPSLDIQDLNGTLNKKQQLYIYRVVQEALQNIVKHSEATEFNIVLNRANDKIILIVSDNGKGFNTNNLIESNSSTGIGVFSMKERIENFKGRFTIDSSADNGTAIFIELPNK